MSEKIIKSRIINKHDTAENWSKATNFIPKQGEVIVYDIDSTYNYERIKIGDGVQNVNALPFAGGDSKKVFYATMSKSSSTDSSIVATVDDKNFTYETGTIVALVCTESLGESVRTVNINKLGAIDLYTDSTNSTFTSIYGYDFAISAYDVLLLLYDEYNHFVVLNNTQDIMQSQLSTALQGRIEQISTNEGDIANLSTLVGDSPVSDQITKAVDGKYAPIDGPEFTSSINMGRKADSTVGPVSVAIGRDTVASADYCCAIGDEVSATGLVSHAEGVETVASGDWSHTEGYGSKATGMGCHAEGYETEAGGYFCHTEGLGTISYDTYQHVQGQYNLEDWSHSYAHIVGNGSSTARSNAHTLDWDGNAWFAGDVYVGGTSQDDATKLTPGVMPNLLDNWYFADPVNSQGRTFYFSGTYAIDRWFMRTSQGNIVDGGFQVYNADGIGFYGITQALNNPTQYCGKTLTFSAKITEINTTSGIEIKIASGAQVAGVGTVINELKNIRVPGIYSVTATIPDTLPGTTLAVWITCRDATVGANYTIESAKLEFGSISTLAVNPAPNKADQVARCSNYDTSGAFLDTLFATQAFVLKYVPKIASITLPTANWTFSSNAYYQDVALSCVTTTSKVDLQPTYAQLAEWQTDGLAFSAVSQNGAVRVWVTDVVPKENITIQVTVQEVLEV